MAYDASSRSHSTADDESAWIGAACAPMTAVRCRRAAGRLGKWIEGIAFIPL
jgi:hypothetical protein